MPHVTNDHGLPDPDRLPDPEALLAWFAREGRAELPWRQTRDPWAVLVSEVMTQQTQVSRVLEPYTAFMARFPTVSACAAASPAEVIELWHGLGYNRRALHLWRAATAVVERHDGVFPTGLTSLLALPGVGPYTARAVQAFAFEADVGVVDTNSARVLARIAGRRLGRSEVQRRADAAVPPGRGWAWNQAMLDLGATICGARAQACERCPVRAGCDWFRKGRPDLDPAIGSAGVSGAQSAFEGSDRQGRGRLVAALRQGPVSTVELATVMGWPGNPARADRVAAKVVADGLARLDGHRYRLPD